MQVPCANKMRQWLSWLRNSQLKMKVSAKASETNLGGFGWLHTTQSLSLPPSWVQQWLSTSQANWAWPVQGRRASASHATAPGLEAHAWSWRWHWRLLPQSLLAQNTGNTAHTVPSSVGLLSLQPPPPHLSFSVLPHKVMAPWPGSLTIPCPRPHCPWVVPFALPLLY